VRTSQHVTPGQTLLSLAGDDAELSIAALFPGHYRPLLEPGMPLRFELTGYRYAYQQLVIERVDDEVIGPSEARRTLGVAAGEALTLNGPLVLATARIPSSNFLSDDELYDYHDGLQGTAEVRVRSERLLPALVPALKRMLRNG
jgi:membrane fusion protein (multidrug efflux system)